MRPTDPVVIDRAIAALIIAALVSVYVLPSQSAASFPTYLLPLVVLARAVIAPFPIGAAKAVAISTLVLLVYFSASVWWSSDVTPRGAFSTYTRCLLIAGFVAGTALTLSRSARTIVWLGRAVTIGAGFAALAALVQFHLHPTWDARLVGLGQLRNSVVAAFTFTAALLIALDVVLNDAKRWRIGAAAAVAVLGAAIIATGSRSGYGGAAAGLWVMAVTTVRAPRTRIAVALVAPAVVGVAALGAMVLEPALLATALPRGDSFRLGIWSAEWQRFAAGNPWFGLGTLTGDPVVIGAQTFAHPHNLYLASALQGGLVGLVTLLTVLGSTAWKLVGCNGLREARLGLALLVGGAAAYLFDGWELIDKVSVSWLVIWLPVSIALALGMPGLPATAIRRESA